MSGTNWLPGIIVLAAGLALGVAFVFWSRRRWANAPAGSDPVRDELEQRYQRLMGQLKELIADQHLHAPEHFAAERARLEREAAAALKARDQHVRGVQHEQQKATARAERLQKVQQAAATGGMNPTLKGALWGGGAVLFFVLLGFILTQESTQRLDGQEMTGKVPGGEGPAAPMQQPRTDPVLEQALRRLERNPEDLEALAQVSHELIQRQDFEQAERLVWRGMTVDPFHVEMRVHAAVLKAVRGDIQKAQAELDHLARVMPDPAEAHLFAGALASESGNERLALEHFEQYAALTPASEIPPQLLQRIQQLKDRAAR